MRRVRNLTEVTVMCALALILSACTPALEPAKPSDFDTSQAQSESPTAPTPQLSDLLNPLEQGIATEWEAEFSTRPLAVTIDDDESQVVVLTERDGKQTIVGLARVGDSTLVEKWVYQLPQGEVENLVARDGFVYFNTVDAIADGSGVDLYSLNIRDGAENFRWSKLNPFDSEAPTIVGSYLRGLGIVKIDHQRVTAAILDDSGKVRASEKFIDSDLSESDMDTDSAHAAGDKSNSKLAESSQQTDVDSISQSKIYQFRRDQVILPESADLNKPRTIVFPMLKALSGEWCEVLESGAVCVERANKQLVQYDRSGEKVSTISLAVEDPAMKYRFVGGLPELQLDTLIRQLAPSAFTQNGKSDERAEMKDADSAQGEAGENIPHSQISEEAVISELPPLVDAYLYGERWIPRDGWSGLSDSSACIALDRQAPFCIDNGSLVNVRSGEKITADDVYVLQGTGNASQNFFTSHDGVLSMLRAATDTEMGNSSQSSEKDAAQAMQNSESKG